VNVEDDTVDVEEIIDEVKKGKKEKEQKSEMTEHHFLQKLQQPLAIVLVLQWKL
jgi:hypothetical protein